MGSRGKNTEYLYFFSQKRKELDPRDSEADRSVGIDDPESRDH